MAARYMGAGTIVVVDPVASKRALADELGATATLDGKGANLVAELREICRGGVDYAFEAAGLPALAAIGSTGYAPAACSCWSACPQMGSWSVFPGMCSCARRRS